MTQQIFTILVADDEEELREAMCRLIDWESVGFRLVGSAGNGLEALQLVEQLQPDLLLTDIQMPFITGTALARQVREVQPLIQVAFLSGYDHFEYAQSAIDSQVIAYLLKPIGMAELTEALREIHAKMEARFNELRPRTEHVSRHLTVASMLLDRFADDPGEETLRRRLEEAGVVFTDPCALTVLAVYAPGLAPGAAQTVEQALQKHFTCCSFFSGGRVLSLVVSEDGLDRLGAALDELLSVCRRLLDSECVIGVSRSFTELGRCPAACREAVDAQRLAGERGILHIGALRAESAEGVPGEAESASALEALLYNGDHPALERHLSRVLEESDGDMAAMRVLLSAQDILRGGLGEEGVGELLRRSGLDDPLSAARDGGEFRRRVAALCLAGQDSIAQSRRDGVSFLCRQALRIVEQEYGSEALSLQSVSERLHVSPNYLSANMKKYAGDTFINLLIRQRMEAALSMIQTGGAKIAEVAAACGYSDQHYFSYCFKKYYGVSPARMRRGEEGGA